MNEVQLYSHYKYVGGELFLGIENKYENYFTCYIDIINA